MPYHLQRHTIYILLFLCNGFALAGEGIDPFDTKAILPPKPALHPESTVSDTCAQTMPNSALNLLDVVNLALCNNPQTHEVWAITRAQAAQIGVSKAGYLPSVSLNASDHRSKTEAGPNLDQRSISLTLSYLLYDFGSRSANLENARQLLAATSASQDNTTQAVFLDAIQAFYQAQATFASLEAAIKSERAAKESFAAAEARYNAGSTTRADKLQAQTAYSQAMLNRITSNGNLKKAQGVLATMIGLDANRNVLLTPANTAAVPASFDDDIELLIEVARRRRPDLQAIAAQVKAAEASADAARASDKPTITLSASTNQNNSSGISTHNSLVGINLSVPIFSGYAPTYRIRAAKAQVEAKTAQLERLRLQVALDVWTAYQNLTSATQSLRTSADMVDSAEQSERVILGRYKAGVGNIIDVLNSQSALAGARQQRVQSLFNWNINRAILAQSMGNLDIDLLRTLTPIPSQNLSP